MNLILGLPPLNQYDAAATDLRDMFTSHPDFAPVQLPADAVRAAGESALAGADQGHRFQPAGSRRVKLHAAIMKSEGLPRRRDASRK